MRQIGNIIVVLMIMSLICFSCSSPSDKPVGDAPDRVENPVPVDGAVDIALSVMLEWEQAQKAESYKVYFGEKGNLQLIMVGLTECNYYVTGLQYETEYNWRIDSVNEYGETGGELWLFTTISDTGQPPPIADFEAYPLSGSAPLLVQFADKSTGSITDWLWEFGDGATSTDQNPVNTYAAVGVYTVKLVATGPGGSDEKTQTDYVRIDLVPSLPNKVTAGIPVDGANGVPAGQVLSWLPAIGATSYDVYFGKQIEFICNQAETTYDPGILAYEVDYYWRIDSVNEHGGAEGDLWSFTTVSEPGPQPPIADFTSNRIEGIIPFDVEFIDKSVGDVTSWSWDFGDGDISSDKNPSHTYVTAGVYSVRLVVVGDSGSDEIAKASYINAKPPLPGKVTIGTPVDGANGISLVEQLRWEPATNADSYNVYFGEILEDRGNQTLTVYAPDSLVFEQKYYWRIDAVNETGITEGDKWSFITRGYAITVPGDYETIQKAVDAASNGDTIEIGNGVWTGIGNRDIEVHKNITIRSRENAFETIIKGRDSGSHGGFDIRDCRVILDGITLQQCYRKFGGGIYAENCLLTVKNCVIMYCAAEKGGGIYCYGEDAQLVVEIENCLLIDNTIIYLPNPDDGRGAAIYGCGNYQYNKIKIANCTIADNQAAAGQGVVFLEGFYTSDASAINSIVVNGYGTETARVYPTWLFGGDSYFKDPLFVVGARGKYYLAEDSPCVDRGIGTAAELGLDKRTTRSDNKCDEGIVDTGYHYDH